MFFVFRMFLKLLFGSFLFDFMKVYNVIDLKCLKFKLNILIDTITDLIECFLKIMYCFKFVELDIFQWRRILHFGHSFVSIKSPLSCHNFSNVTTESFSVTSLGQFNHSVFQFSILRRLMDIILIIYVFLHSQ